MGRGVRKVVKDIKGGWCGMVHHWIPIGGVGVGGEGSGVSSDLSEGYLYLSTKAIRSVLGSALREPLRANVVIGRALGVRM